MLCYLPSLPEAGMPVRGHSPAWSTDPETPSSSEELQSPCAPGPHPSFTKCLYWWAVTPHRPLALTWKAFSCPLTCLNSCCPFLETYGAAERLTHLKQFTTQCSCGKSVRMRLGGGASIIGGDSWYHWCGAFLLTCAMNTEQVPPR